MNRASGNGTTGTAMAVPVIEGEKMESLGFELTCALWNSLSRRRFVIAWDVLHMTRPCLDVFESSSFQSSEERIEAFSRAIFEREAKLGRG